MSAIEPKQVIEERIYLGNVDYKATEDDLKEFFNDFKITEIDIPTKTLYSGKKTLNKSLGFAFIQFESKSEADKVVEEFTGKEFKGRKIYVKKAVPPPTDEEKQKKAEEYKAKILAKKQAAIEAAIANGEEVKAKKPKSKKKESTVSDESIVNDTESATDSSIVKPKKEKRIPKPKLPLEEGTKSIDTVFITNLPFDANIKTLNALFKEFKPKWIHVPTRRVPYKVLQKQKAQGKAPRNKGIAFVKFSDESLQKKAIEEFNGKEVNDRVIVVDVAIDARIPKDTDEEKVEEKAEEKAEEVAESE